MATTRKAHIVYVPHGGGPLPLLGDPGHKPFVDLMKRLRRELPRPDAVVVISAHWEEPVPTVMAAERPPMLYDYYGFPEEAYRIVYPAPGHPDLARRIADLWREAGLPGHLDETRGFDHGAFVPLMLLYPEADIPTVEVSLVHGLDPAHHLAIGKALRPLLAENILFLGSGFSFHNMRAFFSRRPGEPDPANDAFQDWLMEMCTADMPEEGREQRLIAWEKAPHARYCHPREEHLLPLHVCQGLAGRPATLIFDGYVAGVRAVGFLW